MNPNNLTRADLAEFARNAATQVAEGKVTGLLAEQVMHFSASLIVEADSLTELDQDQVAQRAASIEATRKATDKRRQVDGIVQSLKYAMKSAGSPASEFVALGFDAPVRSRQMVTPQTPERLAVQGFSNGVNELSFIGNNTPNSVTYTVEAKSGDAGKYEIIGTTRTQQFKHKGVTPGVHHQYRVRAQASRGLVSDWSNEAVVYRL